MNGLAPSNCSTNAGGRSVGGGAEDGVRGHQVGFGGGLITRGPPRAANFALTPRFGVWLISCILSLARNTLGVSD